MIMPNKLKIAAQTMQGLVDLAAFRPHLENFCLLATPANATSLITTFCKLPAEATGSSAIASGVLIRGALERIEAIDNVAVGVCHSHGRHTVFHSGTDDRMIELLFPMLAAKSLQPRGMSLEPQLLDQDRAQVVTQDGRLLQVRLCGEDFGAGFARRAWLSFHVVMHDLCQPHVRYAHPWVEVVGQRSTLVLGVPDLCKVDITTAFAPHRAATLYSMVVNGRGDTCAEGVTVFDLNGHTLIEREVVEIETVETAKPGDAGRQFCLVRGIQSVDFSGHVRSAVLTDVWNGEGHPNDPH
jgi:hypothetical protein